MKIPHTAGELVRDVSTPMIHRFMRRRLGTVIGLNNIPRSGPLVVVANHSSYLDHFATLTFLHAVRPGEVWYPTKAESFEKFASRTWHESMNCYPVDRTAPGQQVFEIAQRILDEGNILVLYPEGTRGPGKELLPFKSGAFRMALSAGATVVPIGMVGLEGILPKGVHVPRMGTYSASIGAPLPVPHGDDFRECARRMRDESFRRVQELRQQASLNNGCATTSQIDEIVDLAQVIIAENMSDSGLLPEDVIGRLELLLGLASEMSKRHPGLELQRNRVRGFSALSSVPPIRILKVLRIGLEARQASANYRSNDFAAYLAGRTSLLLPKYVGGGAQEASRFFLESAKRGGLMTSQAYVGLAETRLAMGDRQGAIEAYRCARESIRAEDQRGSRRRDRINECLAELGVER
ncbi:1-acyl-sn-glycerol-3-phosphate acyltransferase [Corynebacterium mastitidis]|uniref:1-acyl-sn-glycerol-3-phosphate acyltransferase n=1 Tax=Corynebacterium mastitidis TaxID=161890 RepID=A0ABU8NV85_9CORY